MVSALPADRPLVAALEIQRRLGVLGTSVEDAIAHSERFLGLLPAVGTVLDLGSGAGVPGLVIAWRRPALRVVLLDARQRRTDQLSRLVGRLGLGSRVQVLTGLAEAIGRTSGLAGTIDAVVARSFGQPSAVIAAAAPYLRQGGLVVVSEPPGSSERWPEAMLSASGFAPTPTSEPGFFLATRTWAGAL